MYCNCGNLVAKNRKCCNTCKSRECRAKYPIYYAYDMLKKSAKKRNYPFTITKQWFVDFINKTDYMKYKGRVFDALSIDRINNNKGYEPDNLQVITKIENINKYHQVDKCPF